jgi:hypothetical protein
MNDEVLFSLCLFEPYPRSLCKFQVICHCPFGVGSCKLVIRALWLHRRMQYYSLHVSHMCSSLSRVHISPQLSCSADCACEKRSCYFAESDSFYVHFQANSHYFAIIEQVTPNRPCTCLS